MALDDLLSKFGKVLEGDDLTGTQALMIGVAWMGATALFGLISYIIVFVIIGF